MALSDSASTTFEVSAGGGGTLTPSASWYSDPGAASVYTFVPPPPPQVPTIAAAITDLAGNVRAHIDPESLTLKVDINGIREADFTLTETAVGSSELNTGERAFKLYRKGAIRHAGPVVKLDDDADADSAKVAVVSQDPLGTLASRYVRSEDETPFVQVDAGQIAWSLVNTQNTHAATGLRQGTITASVLRDETYEAGKQVAEAITQLAELDDGFWVVCTPVDEGATFAKLDIRYPTSGTDRTGARFEYGDGTLANLGELSSERLTPINRVTALGAGSGADSQLVSTAEDATSIARYGLWETTVQFTDVSDQGTLDANARAALRPDPVTTYTVKPVPSAIDDTAYAANPTAPRLFDEFDIGDSVRLFAKGGRWDAIFGGNPITCRVTSATVAYSDDAQTEQLTELVLEQI